MTFYAHWWAWNIDLCIQKVFLDRNRVQLFLTRRTRHIFSLQSSKSETSIDIDH